MVRRSIMASRSPNMGLARSSLAKLRALRASSSTAALSASALQASGREPSTQTRKIHKRFMTITSLVLLSVSAAQGAL
ncbi:hypothetical protein D3C76_1794960 [compost metagenome]